jgi:hypothetical protein
MRTPFGEEKSWASHITEVLRDLGGVRAALRNMFCDFLGGKWGEIFLFFESAQRAARNYLVGGCVLRRTGGASLPLRREVRGEKRMQKLIASRVPGFSLCRKPNAAAAHFRSYDWE